MRISQFIGLLLTASVNAVPITDSDLTARGGVGQVLAPGEMLLIKGDTSKCCLLLVIPFSHLWQCRPGQVFLSVGTGYWQGVEL